MKENENKSQLIILTGPSAVGKDETRNRLLLENTNMKRITTATSRPKRNYEEDGIHYFFLTPAKFSEMEHNNRLLEIISYNGFKYGAPSESLDPIFKGTTLLWILGMSTAVKISDILRNHFQNDRAEELIRRSLVIMIGAPRLTVLKDRFVKRGDDRYDIRNRMRNDWEMWQETKNSFENIVINKEGEFERTMREINRIIMYHKQTI